MHAAVLLITAATAAAFVPAPVAPVRHRARAAPLNAAGLYFATMSGNTERVADLLAESTGLTAYGIEEIGEGDLADVDEILVGCPTWNTDADRERSGTAMDQWIYETLPKADLAGKRVALFGCGDSAGYSGNFCDALGELHDCFADRGATLVGFTSQEGYDHFESKAIRDDKFVGLVCDETNQYEMTEDRVSAWVTQLKGEGMVLA